MPVRNVYFVPEIYIRSGRIGNLKKYPRAKILEIE